MAKVLGGRSREMQREASRRGEGAFIGLDEPHHGPKRKAVSPTVAPANIAKMAPVVRERAGEILDSLPIGEPFDWVDKVSMELTAMTLATLFDFPFEQRRRLTRWSDMFMNQPGHGPVESWEQKIEAIVECCAVFQDLWNQRVDAEPGIDLISMLAHDPATRDMELRRVPGQRRGADHRRQRHHPQHHLGQRLPPEQEPRPVRQAARRPEPDARRWSPRPSATRRRWRT